MDVGASGRSRRGGEESWRIEGCGKRKRREENEWVRTKKKDERSWLVMPEIWAQCDV